MKKRLGEILLERRLITMAQLSDALALQRQRGMRLGAALVARGHITEDQLVQALSQIMRIPVVDLTKVVADAEAVELVGARLASEQDLFAYAVRRERGRRVLTVAMSDPLNVRVIDELGFITDATIEPVLARASDIDGAIRRQFGARVGGTELWRMGTPMRLSEPHSEDSEMTIMRRGGDEEKVNTSTGKIAVPPAVSQKARDLLPGAGMPTAPMAGIPAPPPMPAMPPMPMMPGLPAMPGMPGIPSMPSMPVVMMPALPAQAMVPVAPPPMPPPMPAPEDVVNLTDEVVSKQTAFEPIPLTQPIKVPLGEQNGGAHRASQPAPRPSSAAAPRPSAAPPAVFVGSPAYPPPPSVPAPPPAPVAMAPAAAPVAPQGYVQYPYPPQQDGTGQYPVYVSPGWYAQGAVPMAYAPQAPMMSPSPMPMESEEMGPPTELPLGALVDSTGGTVDAETFFRLERRFWGLMRVLAKKGVLTNEDFLKELADEY
jgi:hypothetical protein